MNEGPDRGYYAALDARRLRVKKKPARKRSSEQPHGFFSSPPRHRKPTEDELHETFIEELKAQGRGDVALDDGEAFAVAFNRWLRRSDYDD